MDYLKCLIFLFVIGPKICLEPDYVDFKIVNLGKEATGSIQLVNQTNIPANYQVGALSNKFCIL